jgi:hypothetical protein
VTKACRLCEQEKDESEFYRFFDRWTDKHYLSARCKPCHQEYKRQSPTTPRNRKAEKLQLRYGLTYEQWEKMREKEGYRCMVCGITEDELGKHLDVDHCHDSGKVRGLLCNPCNTMIGHSRDNIAVLEAAARYLKENCGGYRD